MPHKSGSSQKTVGKTKNEGFDATVNNFLNKFYDFKVVTEEKCYYAVDGCDCNDCADCKANQK